LAISLLWETFGQDLPRNLPVFRNIPERQISLALDLIRKNINSPVTTSVGRLFDGFSALLGLSFYSTHQADSAQALEYAAWKHGLQARAFNIPIVHSDMIRLDWRDLIRETVEKCERKIPVPEIAASFHHSLMEAALAVCRKIERRNVVLAGGVFCNRYLTEILLQRLQSEGFRSLIHSQLPPTDGSLAAGQLWVAAHRLDSV
jgi:hydrogenase maturation protein HypF